MSTDLLISGGLNLLFALLKSGLAFFVLWVMLRTFDEASNIQFSEDVLAELKAGNYAVGIYFGCRFLGASLLAGLTYIVPL